MVAEFMEETELMESEQHARAPEGLQLKHLYDAPEMLNNLIKALQIAEELDNIGKHNLKICAVLDYKWIFNSHVIGGRVEFTAIGKRICQWD